MADKKSEGNKPFMEALIRPSILAMKPYHVPKYDNMTKLDAMENPYALPPQLQEAWLHYLADIQVNRYPDPSASALKTVLASQLDTTPDRLILGNGSDELIQMLILLTAGQGRPIMSPVPSFVMYQVIATIAGCEFIGVPLNHNFDIDRNKMLSAIQRYDPACIFISWPNNPTGNCFDSDAIEEIIQVANGLVVLDEAYNAFSRRSFIDRLDHYNNLMVMRTVSKSGLAGLRLGFLTAHRNWIEQLEKVRL
ncbi:MAG: aminotransferase class I/II-fold pyridoxal phosphate-dependent enzyme, partial [Gammaproteobacteria bacterium]|nr:aminotransferase class I/II-fold pyridoxal phosphate-dependent enzyme [Gammaproteobacteria bacterium]